MFDNLYTHGFVRVAVCVPLLRVADPKANAAESLRLARLAHAEHAALALFPELGISSYTNDELFFQDALLDEVNAQLAGLVEASRELRPVLIVGAPFAVAGRLFNCAFVIQRGKLLGIVPKAYLPNYREFYEKRYFASGLAQRGGEVRFAGETVPFGTDLLFAASDVRDFVIHVEICEDVWTAIPPSSHGALAGATVLANLSASNITVGKAQARRDLCGSQSMRCIAAYLYSAAGPGESTTDLAWDGHVAVFENGELLAEGERFAEGAQMITADLDLERLRQERMRVTSFGDSADRHAGEGSFRKIAFALEPPLAETVALRRRIDRYPFVPSDAALLDENCYEAFNIQVHGLMTRLAAIGARKVVLGISGGLDSTHALIVAARAFDRLGYPRQDILCYTLPGFATSKLTKSSAHSLMQAFGVSAQEIDITPVARQTLIDIGHPNAQGEPVYDVTFENVQAGARTALLFRLANFHDAIVMGTGDLSELALGWCTYGVGDQMSHYNVNGSVPKTLIQHLIRWVADRQEFGEEASAALRAVLATEISPELVPSDGNTPGQRTEDFIGPYSLQDFNLYYLTRYGLRPSKVAYLSWNAWRAAEAGTWPVGFREADKRAYDLATIRRWLRVFLFRFFQISQFKRSAMPNGPKVGSGGSLSPRGDWRAPSDSHADAWLAELDANVPENL
ncbi:NAD+ synthase (glutamine-hydrolysing) [Rhizobiales bacterium GAS191]|nr:NAD+ synthase (glutamine-hydrolysing) [Rhizobiales bacterium GAS113]SEE94058.1 NAD+ synthase (glutamine-hydrolysing) [Rhizobiales bacterium GAS191]